MLLIAVKMRTKGTILHRHGYKAADSHLIPLLRPQAILTELGDPIENITLFVDA